MYISVFTNDGGETWLVGVTNKKNLDFLQSFLFFYLTNGNDGADD